MHPHFQQSYKIMIHIKLANMDKICYNEQIQSTDAIIITQRMC